MKITVALPALLFIILAGFENLWAQKLSGTLETGASASCRTLELVDNFLVFENTLSAVSYRIITIDQRKFLKLEIPGYGPSGMPGEPELPAFNRLFEMDRSYPSLNFQFDMIDSVIIDIGDLDPDLKIVPFQPSLSKSASGRDEFLINDRIFSLDTCIGGPVLQYTFQGTMRGLPVSNLCFSPIQYNPAENRLIIYHRVAARLALPEPFIIPGNLIAPPFERLHNHILRQERIPGTKAISVEEPMTMVILSDTIFREILYPFIEWKKKKGFRIIEAYTQDPDVGNTRESIKSYLENLYLNPEPGYLSPAYLIIAGDVNLIPVSDGSFYTDLYYAEYDGNGDYIPDLFYGRMSAQTPSHLQVIVNKSIMYEQYGFPDPSYLKKSLLVAGGDNASEWIFSNGQINYGQAYYFNLNNGIECYMINAPSADSMNWHMRKVISEGVGFVNYTGHATTTYWKDPYFSISQIDELDNDGKYPLVIGNGCQSGAFQVGECFGEALLWAENKGALAYIGCTYDAYWEEDYFWSVGVGEVTSNPAYENTGRGYYDKVFHLHGEPRVIWAPSLGEMIYAGNMSVQESNSSRKAYYWRIYHILGDPSIIPWFRIPENISLRYPAVIPPGTSHIDISGLPYDYIAVSQRGTLINAAHANKDGYYSVYLPDTLTEGYLSIVATGENRIPFMDSIFVGTPEGSFLDLIELSYSGESIKADQIISNGESFSLDLKFINRGSQSIISDTITLFSNDYTILLIDTLTFIESLMPGDTLIIKDCFGIKAIPESEDQTPFILGIRTSGDIINREIYHRDNIAAPRLISLGMDIDDRKYGNGDGIIDPGESVELIWQVKNAGSYCSGFLDIYGDKAGDNKTLDFIDFRETASLQEGEDRILRLKSRFRTDLKDSVYQIGPFELSDGAKSISDSMFVNPGRHFDRFNSGDFRKYLYQNNASISWIIDTAIFYSSGYAARSGKIADNNKSELSLSFKTTVTDSISFKYRVLSEPEYDYFRFYVNSNLLMQRAGITDWNSFTAILEPGDYKVVWSYEKDQSISSGQDAAWVDDIVFPADAFRNSDLSLSRILAPNSGPWLTDSEHLEVLLRNTGKDTIREVFSSYSVDGSIRIPGTHPVMLLPGDSLFMMITDTLDLSEFALYEIWCSVTYDGDQFPGNNNLGKEAEHYRFPDIALENAGIDSFPGVYTDLMVNIRNTGNIPMDSMLYRVYVDERLMRTGLDYFRLNPAESILKSFTLIDSTDTDFGSGLYTYLFEACIPDSVAENNRITGEITWRIYSVKNYAGEMTFSIYPNPVNDGFFLYSEAPFSEVIWFSIVDLHGKMMKEFKMETGEQCRFIPFNPGSGMYLLKSKAINRAIKIITY
ncbi:MAG TPA: T9SS type A sorting domain-containing protein [Bacteroidaceae bacterium]|nr:T9SS type A sorting domain-containing protein [Bacteroidaceae bacterium]